MLKILLLLFLYFIYISSASLSSTSSLSSSASIHHTSSSSDHLSPSSLPSSSSSLGESQQQPKPRQQQQQKKQHGGGSDVKLYHGLIREDEYNVEIKPNINTFGICGFHILQHRGISEQLEHQQQKQQQQHYEIPFEIIINNENNQVSIKSKRLLNCEKKKNYKFDFISIGCDGDSIENSTIHITVQDVNEYEPIFLEPSYIKSIDEGTLYNNIIRIEATDRDCSSKYGDICKYEIKEQDTPFIIDGDGVLSNIEPCIYEKSHNYILSIIAYDCGMKGSKPVLVNIKINRICSIGWKGLPERIDYTPGSKNLILFPEIKLQTCDIPCNIKQIETKLELKTNHIGKGCDRDTYDVVIQRKLCGAKTNTIDLLPNPTSGTSDSQDEGAGWTNKLQHDDGYDSDSIYEFDGQTTAVIIPHHILTNLSLDRNFTISTWLKHGENDDKHMKEHIICSSDDHKMNRHHFALFIRNCRLILLLRKEHNNGDLNTFKPAEWRWKIPEVCSPSWHHYSIGISFPSIILSIDGIQFKTNKNNPEIIDDWPLHPTKLNITTSIGACWQGGENKFKYHFNGYLNGLNILMDGIEDGGVLKCINKCNENLVIPTLDYIQPGMELMTNNDMTEITIEGENTTDIENVIKHISYINTREFPTPGRRNIHLTTKVICESSKIIKIIPSDTFIMVVQSQKLIININGTRNLPRDYEDFRLGVRVFSDVRIITSSNDGSGGQQQQQQQRGEQSLRDNINNIEGDMEDDEEINDEPINAIEKKLDSCTITIYPPLNPDHESIKIPINIINTLGIGNKITIDGLILNGPDMIYNYEQVLRQIQYINKKPAYYLNRAFKLYCSELNNRFISNEYIQTLTVIHPDLTKHDELVDGGGGGADASDENKYENEYINKIGHSMINEHMIDVPSSLQQQQSHDKHLHATIQQQQQQLTSTLPTTHAITIIIVVCIGFLLFMIVLGVVRIRGAHARQQQEDIQDVELQWDDSSLNIIINPMETMTSKHHLQIQQQQNVDTSDSDSAEDSDDGESGDDLPRVHTTIKRSEDDDEDDEEEEENEQQLKLKQKKNISELDWDPSI